MTNIYELLYMISYKNRILSDYLRVCKADKQFYSNALLRLSYIYDDCITLTAT